MKINSLRVRFALWVSGFLLSALILFGVYVYLAMARNLYAAMDDALRLSATQASDTLNVDQGMILLSDNLPENQGDIQALRASGLSVRFLDAQGQPLGGFGADWNVPPGLIQPSPQAAFVTSLDHDGEPADRVYTLPVLDNDKLVGYVQTAKSLEGLQQTLDRLGLSLLLGIPFLTLLAALGGYFLAGRALQPVDEITRTARRISAQDLSARLNLPDRGDELGRLASTFNDMLARLDDSFRRERQFTADASHELRTPLAAMQAIISVTRSQKRSADEYQQALDDLGEETSRLRSLTEDLLLLARGETSGEAHLERVELSSLLDDVAESLTPLAEARGLQLKVDVPPDLAVEGDQDGLIRLFVNLLDNAIKFTQSGRVTLRAQSNAKNVQVEINDTGVGIAAQHLAHIFDRFYRADTSRSHDGSGLGLAIALQIAHTLRGDITVSSKLGAGTTFLVTLPAC